MFTRKHRLHLVVTLSAATLPLWAAVIPAQAGSVGLNAVGHVIPGGELVGAPGYKHKNWNNADDVPHWGDDLNGGKSAGTVWDSSGAIVGGMALEWHTEHAWDSWSSGSTQGNIWMMNYAWIEKDWDGSGAGSSVTASGIPYNYYDVVTYCTSNHDRRGPVVSVTGSVSGLHPDAYAAEPSNAGFNGTFLQATSTNPGAPTIGANYTVHQNVQGPTATITWSSTGLGSWPEGWVTGIQILGLTDPVALNPGDSIIQDESTNAFGLPNPYPPNNPPEPAPGDGNYHYSWTFSPETFLWRPMITGEDVSVEASWGANSNHTPDADYYFDPDGAAGPLPEILLAGDVSQRLLADQSTPGSLSWSGFLLIGQDLDLTLDSTFRVTGAADGALTSGMWRFGVPQPEGEVPEPATMALLGLAAAGLGAYARKRKRVTMKHLMTILVGLGFVLAASGQAMGQCSPKRGTNLNFFDPNSWDQPGGMNNGPPRAGTHGARWDQLYDVSPDGIGSMIYDPATQSPANEAWYEVATSGSSDARAMLGIKHTSGIYVDYTFTQKSGNLIWALPTSGRNFAIGHDAKGTYVLDGGSIWFRNTSGVILGASDVAGSLGVFDQNGGDVIVSGTLTGLYIGRYQPGHVYHLGGGTLTTEELYFDGACPDSAGSGTGDGTLDFDSGSTGILYVRTSNKTAADIAALITGSDITIGGAAASPSDFAITELTSGPYAGYTEVKLPAGPEGEVPEPATMALLGLALTGLGAYARKRRRPTMFRTTKTTGIVLTAVAALVMAGAQSALAQEKPVAGTGLNFFVNGNWQDGSTPNAASSYGIRFGEGISGNNSMIYDPATQSPGNMTYSIGTAANTGDYYLGRTAGGSYTFTQQSGDLTWGYRSDVNYRKLEMASTGDGTYIMDGGTARFGSRGLRLQSGAAFNSLFDHNAGDVIVADMNNDLGLWVGNNGAGTATYNLGGGTLTTEALAINTDGVLNFDAGSTGILYVNTSDKSASDIAALITAGDITLGGAAANPSDFLITELTTGPYPRYTEVKLPAGPEGEIPEPATLAMMGMAAVGLGGYVRRRRQQG